MSSNGLDEKIRTVFGEFAIDKSLIRRLGVSGDDRHIPSYVMDWIVTHKAKGAPTTATLQKAVQDTMDRHHHATIDLDFQLIRGAFHLDPEAPIIAAFQQAHKAVSGKPLKFGAKPFVDDANSFSSLANVPAITHGPQAGGAHTTSEWVLIDDLVRVAHLYALTAALYCNGT